MTILDDIRGNRKAYEIINTEHKKFVQGNIHRARQFIFDKDASEFIAEFITKSPELLFKNFQFAIPPYPVTYIEYDFKAFQDQLAKNGIAIPHFGVDEKVGYLFIDDMIYVCAYSNDSPIGSLISTFSLRNQNHNRVKRNIFPGLSRLMKSRIFFASMFETLSLEIRTKIAEDIDIIDILPETFSDKDKNDIMERILISGAGDVRNALALLLFLYQKEEIMTFKDIPPSRKIVKGKQQTYMAHSVVTIHLRGKRIIKKLMETTVRDSYRRHEVRPYYRTRHAKFGCDHTWDETSIDHWKCEHCAAIRIRVKKHERGDASKGFVTKHYEVTT